MAPVFRTASFGQRAAGSFIDGFVFLLPSGVAWVLGPVVFLIAIYGIATDDHARGIHDKLARTRVIEAI